MTFSCGTVNVVRVCVMAMLHTITAGASRVSVWVFGSLGLWVFGSLGLQVFRSFGLFDESGF